MNPRPQALRDDVPRDDVLRDDVLRDDFLQNDVLPTLVYLVQDLSIFMAVLIL